jgi:hypothetical protein
VDNSPVMSRIEGTLQKEFRTGRNSPLRMEVTILARCTEGVDAGDLRFAIWVESRIRTD